MKIHPLITNVLFDEEHCSLCCFLIITNLKMYYYLEVKKLSWHTKRELMVSIIRCSVTNFPSLSVPISLIMTIHKLIYN